MEKKVFCIPCTLFCSHENRTQLSYFGFNDWKNASAVFASHEKSIEHRNCTVSLMKRLSSEGIDHRTKEQYEEEKRY